MKTTPWASGPGSGGSTVRLGAGSFSTLTTVLCAKAPSTSRAVAATVTSVLMSGIIAKSPLGKLHSLRISDSIGCDMSNAIYGRDRTRSVNVDPLNDGIGRYLRIRAISPYPSSLASATLVRIHQYLS